MEPPIIQQRRKDFMAICEDISMPYQKANLLCNCYINQLTLQSVYHENVEESIKGIKRLLKAYDKPVEIVYDCLKVANDKG